MGFWRRLIGRPDVFDDLEARLNETETLFSAPQDPALWKLAEESKNHISLKAVQDEYDRLILAKHKRRWW
jgi:hypothetical protein